MAKTHNFSGDNRRWGHDYYVSQVYEDGMRLRAGGWGNGIKDGDYLILDGPTGGTTRYQIESVEYKMDPKDMWFAYLEFAPREGHFES